MKYRISLFSVSFLILCNAPSYAQNDELILNKSFIKKYEDKALITTTFEIRHAHSRPNPVGNGSNDGDLHASGIPSKEIQLPTVIEIMNAREDANACGLLTGGGTVNVTGVWRIWPEHPGQSQSQNDPVTLDPDNTNPNHLFEVHPITNINDHTTIGTLGRIQWQGNEFDYKDASSAIGSLKNSSCRLVDEGDGTVGVFLNKIGYNYIKFKAKLLEKPNTKLGDGFTVQVDLLDLDGTLLDSNIRLVFVDGSAVATKVWSMNKGQQITLLGIPRVSLKLMDSRVSSKTDLDANIPFELVALGSFD